MQNEVVALALDLVDAPERCVGHVAADRNEAALLPVLARESRPAVQRPAIVVADTVHPAYPRAARLLGVKVLTVHTDTPRRAQVGPMTHAMDVRARPGCARRRPRATASCCTLRVDPETLRP